MCVRARGHAGTDVTGVGYSLGVSNASLVAM